MNNIKQTSEQTLITLFTQMFRGLSSTTSFTQMFRDLSSTTSCYVLITGLFALLVYSVAVFSTSENASIMKLKKRYNFETTIHLTFDLAIYWKIREKTERKQGEIILSPENKFYCKIGATQWISNGITYWQYNKYTSQVIINNFRDIDISSHPSQMIESYLNYPYSVKSSKDNETVLEWLAEEKEFQNKYQKITLWINNSKVLITKIQVIDKNGNVSTYTFKKTKINTRVPENRFSFKIPKGADILDTRE
jgi:outer membrane lipoprotein carrier protein